MFNNLIELKTMVKDEDQGYKYTETDNILFLLKDFA